MSDLTPDEIARDNLELLKTIRQLREEVTFLTSDKHRLERQVKDLKKENTKIRKQNEILLPMKEEVPKLRKAVRILEETRRVALKNAWSKR